MFAKCFGILGLLAVARAGLIPGAAVVAPAAIPQLARIEDFDPVPQYSFAYDVQDSITGDSKAQYETRNGDVVQGSYSLIEADGTRRIVDYTADDVNGFNAVVSREPAIAAAPIVARSAVVPAPAAPLLARAPVVAASGVIPPRVASYVARYPAVAPAPAVARFAAPLTYAAAGYAV